MHGNLYTPSQTGNSFQKKQRYQAENKQNTLSKRNKFSIKTELSKHFLPETFLPENRHGKPTIFQTLKHGVIFLFRNTFHDKKSSPVHFGFSKCKDIFKSCKISSFETLKKRFLLITHFSF